MKHKIEDYKISAIKYFINNEVNMDEVCEIFKCKKYIQSWGLFILYHFGTCLA